ncbi:hypothetical protein [Rhizobium sp. PEPV16]|uniref:hypothetical protein n=1 Tax=Rhizobium sp. PEPV16 TaxID=1820614 RepID=UPI00124DE896|nr:hypothetical protein [Rhizobium sp. PEPV16]KAF5887448.1 hypothetical protein FY112_03100 [Rhizobium sp. PEPV16]
MKPDKLRNLLQSVDTRLSRAEKSLVDIDGRSGQTNDVVKMLADLRAETRRQISKVDSLRPVHVSAIEKQALQLRYVAASRLSAFGPNTPISGPLQAISDDTIGISNLLSGLMIGMNQLEPEEVLESLPGQKPAAFQFGFEGERLVIVDQPLRARERDREIAIAALEAATEKGVYVVEQLAVSNCSPRLKDAFRSLQDKLEARANIIQVGMYNQTCGRVFARGCRGTVVHAF